MNRTAHRALSVRGVHLSLKIIAVALVALPVWWFLGIEQLIWLVIGVAAVVASNKLYINITTICIITFVFIQVISILFITDLYRYLSFIRIFVTNISAIFIYIAITTNIKTIKDIRLLIRALSIMMLISALMGLLATFGLRIEGINSLFGVVLPDSLKETDYGQRFVIRSLGSTGYFYGIGAYYRVNSFWMFATTYAMAIVTVWPLVLWAASVDRKRRLLHIITAVLLLINLIFTTGRTAIIGLIIGYIYIKWIYHNRTNYKIVIMYILGITITIGVISFYIINNKNILFVQSQGNSNVISSLLTARGGGSYSSRMRVYQETLKGFTMRPLLGWGTERDIPNLPYPAGSHSYYLGVLYKNGIIGLLSLLCLLFSAWREMSRCRNHKAHSDLPTWISLQRYVLWGFVAAMIAGITDAWDLDGLTFIVIWIVIAIGVSACHVARFSAARMSDNDPG